MRDLADMAQSELESLHMPTTDELTTLTNRHGFVTLGSHVFSLGQRHNSHMTLLYFALDKFKQINDQYGHAEGDEVLKIFAQLLLNNFRNSDLIARLGGDEFCVLCSDLPESRVEQLLQRFNQSIETEVHKEYKIEYSVGIIFYDEEKHFSLPDMISEADEKMYSHKRGK